jgi:DNA-binding MarR family transcriptional regulator
MMAASRVLTAVVSRSLTASGRSVTTPQLRVLVLLSSKGPLNLTAVAQALGVNLSNASRTCDQLVAGRLVVRREDPEDRRSIVLSLSRSGNAFVEKLMAYRRAVFTEIAEHMDAKALAALVRGLEAFLRTADNLSSGDLDDDDGHLLRWLT